MLTHFIVSSDLERSRRFYTEVLGGELVMDTGPVIVQLVNGWVIINTGGGPTALSAGALRQLSPGSQTRGAS